MTTQSKTKTQQHTPGPWTAQTVYAETPAGLPDFYEVTAPAAVPGRKTERVALIPAVRRIAQPTSWHNGLASTFDNARLIAAAPDMRDALETALAAMEHVDNPMIRTHAESAIRAAIAKATGAQS